MTAETSSLYLRSGKRWLDVTCTAVGLIVLSPLLAIVAAAVKLTSRGPALFRQIRLGQFGKPFWMFKFRTMVEGASAGSSLTAAGDPRITPLGAWLRKTKIDELPQLFNVFLGDMSLVGPRPEVPEYTAGYTERQKRVFAAKPGVTGPSINVYEEELLARQFDKESFYLKTILPAKLEIDIQYAESVTFRGDLKLILATFPKIFGRLRDLFQSHTRTTRRALNKDAPKNATHHDRFHSRHREERAPMRKSFDLYSRANQMILDGSAFAASLLAAFVIRFGGWPNGAGSRQLLLWLPVLVSARLSVHWARGIYLKIWRFVSFSDALDIAKSIALVSAVLAGLRWFYPAHQQLSPWLRLPLTVVAIEGIFSLALSMGFRALRRIQYARQRKMEAAAGESPRRVLLYGAGRAGITLRRELETNRSYDVLGFIDDDPRKLGSIVGRTRVIGCGDDLVHMGPRYSIDEVLICMATATNEALARVLAKCRASNVTARIIPSVQELLTGLHPTTASLEPGAQHASVQATSDSHADSGRANSDSARNKHVLVVGGGGYVGSALVRKLLARQYRVRVLDSLLYGDVGIRELYSRADFELIRGDSRNVEAVVRACRDIGAVIHLGAIVGDAACALHPSRTVETNLAATKMIVEICKGYGVARFLFASTCSVYGESDGIVDEESPANPVSLYASTKLDSEGIISNAASSDFHPTILRLATAFGSSYRLRFDLVVNLLAIKALTERRITVYGGRQWRPFIHVDDIARCFILCLESRQEKVSRQIFNAGSDNLNFTIADLARIISKCIPNVKIEYAPGNDLRDYHVSFARVQEQLGFLCEKGIEDAVFEFKQLYEARLIADYRDRQYSNHDFLKTQRAEAELRPEDVSLPIAATLRSLSDIQGILSKSQSA